MIDLNEIEERVFEIKDTKGEVHKYDLVDLMKELSDLFGLADLAEGEELGQAVVLNNLSKIKDIFKLPELTSTQALTILPQLQDAFDKEFGDLADTTELKKNSSMNASDSVVSSDSSTEKLENSAPAKE